MSSESAVVTITRQSGYQFSVDFGETIPQLLTDEPPPLGETSGPAPNQLLLAALANCLSASLLFALQKFKQDPGTLKAVATADVGRNEDKRLRIQGVTVRLELGKAASELEHIERVLDQFEAFCTVSMSVQQGIPMTVQVQDGTGATIKG